MCPYVSLCVPLCPPVSLYQLHPLSGQRLLGCPRENHSTLHIFSKYPPATNVHNMHIYVHSIIRSTHGGWLFNGCPTAQPTTECKKRICPKKLSKSRQSGLPCENLEHQKINDTNHDFLHINGEGLIHQVAPQMIENIMKGKKHEGHIGAKIILTFLVWGKQQFFTADFFLKSPKSAFLIPPQLEPGKPPGLKSHTCEFVIFGLLTRCDWMAVSDGIKNGRRVNGPPQEIGAYVTKIGQKRRSALFIITGATSSTARPSGGEIKPLWDFLRNSAANLCIRCRGSALYLHFNLHKWKNSIGCKFL